MYHPKEIYQLKFEFEYFEKLIEEQSDAFINTDIQSLKWNLIFQSPALNYAQECSQKELVSHAQSVYEMLADYEGFPTLKLFILHLLHG